jgi:siroheme synthase (precorrin-2 oxidase/ferrochelatase)
MTKSSKIITTEGSSSVDKLKINSLLDNLCNILLNSAKSTFGTSEYSKVKHIGEKKFGKLKKDWFNDSKI